MFSLKHFAQSAGAALALAAMTISGTATAELYSPLLSWGMGPRANLGFGPFGQSMGVDPLQGDGMWSSNPPQWGMNPQSNIPPIAQQNFGTDPFAVYLGVGGPRWLWGMNPQQNANLGFGPFGQSLGVWPVQNMGINPYFPTWGMARGPSWGTSPQQNFHFGPFPYLGMNPQYPPLPAAYITGPQMQAPQQTSANFVQCSINTVAALTRSVSDCEKAGGEAVKQPVADNSSR